MRGGRFSSLYSKYTHTFILLCFYNTVLAIYLTILTFVRTEFRVYMWYFSLFTWLIFVYGASYIVLHFLIILTVRTLFLILYLLFKVVCVLWWILLCFISFIKIQTEFKVSCVCIKLPNDAWWFEYVFLIEHENMAQVPAMCRKLSSSFFPNYFKA